MQISYCTTCHGRLWQLKQTLDHNLRFIIPEESELCIVTYNDSDAYDYLVLHYENYINDGCLRLLSHNEDKVFSNGTQWSCGYVKNLAHQMGAGNVLFNLDADNFIDKKLYEALLSLNEDEVLITLQSEWRNDGRSGRIGVSRSMYGNAKYRDKGQGDDGDFIGQCIALGAKVRQIRCAITPIDNER